MDIECKKFAKDVRLLDKEMRTWDTYIQLEATVKNMLTSLRAVGELQNPAIRERHWHQLMTSTKVIFRFSFSLIIYNFIVSTIEKCISVYKTLHLIVHKTCLNEKQKIRRVDTENYPISTFYVCVNTLFLDFLFSAIIISSA